MYNSTLYELYRQDKLSLHVSVSTPLSGCVGDSLMMKAFSSSHEEGDEWNPLSSPVPLANLGASWWIELVGPALLTNVSSLDNTQHNQSVYNLYVLPMDPGVYQYTVRLDMVFCGEFQHCVLTTSSKSESLRPMLQKTGSITIYSCESNSNISMTTLSSSSTSAMVTNGLNKKGRWLLYENNYSFKYYDPKINSMLTRIPKSFQWLHFIGDSLTYNSFMWVVTMYNLPMIQIWKEKTYHVRLYGSEKRNLWLSFAQFTGRLSSRTYSTSDLNHAAKSLLESFLIVQSISSSISRNISVHMNPQAVIFNSGLHMVQDYSMREYTHSIQKFFQVIRMNYAGLLVWRNTAATQFHTKKLSPLFKCRFNGRIQIFNQIAEKLLTHYNVSECVVDAWSMTLPRRDECGDNRHYHLLGLGNGTVDSALWNATLGCVHGIL